MKHTFKIRFNTEYKKTPDLCWRAVIDDVEHLVSDVCIDDVQVKTISHTLPTGEQKWSIYCESDKYTLKDNHLTIGK